MMFCFNCWAWVETEENETDGTVCSECKWINLYYSEDEAWEAGRHDAELARGERG
jgi:hypothetical protein